MKTKLKNNHNCKQAWRRIQDEKHKEYFLLNELFRLTPSAKDAIFHVLFCLLPDSESDRLLARRDIKQLLIERCEQYKLQVDNKRYKGKQTPNETDSLK